MSLLQRRHPRSLELTPSTAPIEKSLLIPSGILLGLVSLTAQVVVMREMVVASYGNELSLGLTLGGWLLWGGIGSFIAGRYFRGGRALPLGIGLANTVLAIVLPATLVWIRLFKGALGIHMGEIIGIGTILAASIVLTAPTCLLLGFLFVLNARASGGVIGVGRIYLLEAAGGAAGGALVTFLLLPQMTGMEIILSLSALCLTVAVTMATRSMKKTVRALLAALPAAGLAAAVCLGWVTSADESVQQGQWKELGFVETVDSVYGRITVTKRFEQVGLYESGLLVFSHPDRPSAEESVHYALLQHPAPGRVLLLGGWLAGGLEEALKVETLVVDAVELDSALIEAALRNIGPGLPTAMGNERARIHTGDGRRYVQSTHERYDVVIMNLPEPFTARINRFYTAEFFREVASILAPGGLFSFRVASDANYIDQSLSRYLSSMKRTLDEVFAEVVVFPGATNLFFAAPEGGTLSGDADLLVRRIRQRRLETRTVNEHFIPFRLATERRAYLDERIDQGDGRINRDLTPVCYYYDTILWGSQFIGAEREMMRFLADLHPAWLLVLCLAPTVLFTVIHGFRRGPLPSTILASIVTAGFTGIALEFIALLTFQVFQGVVFTSIGLILASFMVGLALGAATARRGLARPRNAAIARLIAVLAAQALLAVALLQMVHFFAGGTFPEGFIEPVLLLFMLLAGAAGGFQFTTANDLFLAMAPDHHPIGTPYAADLLGAALGAVTASGLLVPVFGLPFTLVLTAGINMVMAVMFFLFGFSSRAVRGVLNG